MKLPSLPFLKKSAPKEYFLALLLQDEFLRAVVFEENNGIIHVIGEGKSTLPAPLDDTSFEELLNASDKAISTAESTLPANTQSHKTIFGVKEDWTENLQISKDHLATLKKLCDELDLQPIGFLVFAEAIAHLLQKEEGAPVSAVLVELGTKHITATLLRAGRVAASQQTSAEEPITKAVDSLLMKFTDVEILPSRIILMDNEKRPQIVKQFTNHTWNKQLPFLHIPQVTPLPDGFETQAILFGTATQMGFDMLGIPELKTEKQESRSTNQENIESNSEGVAEEEGIPEARTEQSEGAPMGRKLLTGPLDEEAAENEVQEVEQSSSGEEIATSFTPSARGGLSRNDNDEPGENFGFVQDADVLENAPRKPVVADNFRSSDSLADEVFADIPEEVKEGEEKSRLPGLGASGVQITEGMKKILKNLKKLPFSSFLSPLKQLPSLIESSLGTTGNTKKLIFLLPIALIFIIGSIIWYIFGIRATAILFINPKNVTATQGVTFSSTNSTNIGSDTIGGKTTPITENGSVSTQATGSQNVGDKAKGAVTIYNNDNDSHTIASGTTITSSNGLKFTTNQDVTVASASGDIFSGTQPGTTNVDVTASDIGTDYNLPSGTKFSIGSSTIMAAKNSNAFSGGTKKTVTVVSQKDLDKLTSDLTNNLGDKAKQDAQNNTNGDKVVLSTFLSTDMTNQKFDHKLGDQTSNINLSATITYKALVYNKADLNKVALAILQSNNSGEDISSENVSEDIQKPTVSSDGNSVNATLSIKAGLLPKVDTAKVAQELAGKSFSQAPSSLSDIPQLASVQGILSPNLFFLPKSFPRFASHITIGIKANE